MYKVDIPLKNLITLLRIIRYQNLLFIVMTQYLLRYLLLKPIMDSAGMVLTLDGFHFALLVCSTVCIAAAGYVINDYFDVKMDLINKPGKVYIDRSIKRRTAMLVHQVLTLLGIGMGFYLAWKIGNIKLGFIQPIVAGLLWFYSTGYKKQTLVGNLVVSLLTALVIILVIFYEPHLFSSFNDYQQLETSGTIFKFFFVYFLFAFLVSLVREIVKDMEDKEGDEKHGAKTLPISVGMLRTKMIVYALIVLTMILLGYTQVFWISKEFPWIAVYVFVLIQQPLLISLYLLWKAETQKDFGRISNLVKFVMAMEILSIAFIYYQLW